MKRYLVFIVLFLIPSVMGFEFTERCLNVTHKESILVYTDCDSGTCTNNNITQVLNCTMGCDTKNNICKYVKNTGMGDIGAMLGLGIASALFIVLGFTSSKSHLVLQLLFSFVGLYLILLTIGTARSVAESSGASAGTIAQVESGLTATTWSVYIFIVYFFMNFLYNTLMGMLPKKKFQMGNKV